jgi:hypothetical protein
VQKSCNQGIPAQNRRHWGIMPIPLSASGHIALHADNMFPARHIAS